jgi:prefoldin subunit 1
MSNLSDDTLRKVGPTDWQPTDTQILEQIQQQAILSQRELSVVRSQIQNKERERKILELTMRELDTIPAAEDKMFRGVGKM